MKKLGNFLTNLAGFYRLVICLALLLITVFSLIVDNHLIFATFDLLGFENISIQLIKPIVFTFLLIIFLVNAFITRRIFKSKKESKYCLSVIIFGFLFILTDGFFHLYLRNLFAKYAYVGYIFNSMLILGAIFLLVKKDEHYSKVEKVKIKDNIKESKNENLTSMEEVNENNQASEKEIDQIEEEIEKIEEEIKEYENEEAKE